MNFKKKDTRGAYRGGGYWDSVPPPGPVKSQGAEPPGKPPPGLIPEYLKDTIFNLKNVQVKYILILIKIMDKPGKI